MPRKKQFPLRISAELYAAIEEWANDEFRSVNSHIEFLLREALRKSGRSIKQKNKPNRSGEEDQLNK